ncbi:MAG: hypothetical protein EXR83_00750 [Gammaproteobacteria bacterium]|nr:hypothetical protein [Gammaproteobacteria bacterium]
MPVTAAVGRVSLGHPARAQGLSPAQIQQDLSQIAEAAGVSQPHLSALLTAIAELDHAAQEFIHHWAETLAWLQQDLAAHFLAQVPDALAVLEQPAIEGWLLRAMDAFDQRGLAVALEVLQDLPACVAAQTLARTGCTLDQIAGFLRHFIRALGGRPLAIVSDPLTYTDTDKIYLPALLITLPEPAGNARLLKCMAVYLWAQNRFGTWRYGTVGQAITQLDVLGWQVFQRLESVRIMACIGRELPGLGREMDSVAYADAAARRAWGNFSAAAQALEAPHASAQDSLALVAACRALALPPPRQYQGEMLPQKVAEAIARRVPREKDALRQALASLTPDAAEKDPDHPEETPPEVAAEGAAGNRYSLAQTAPNAAGEPQYELRYDGQKVALTAELDALLQSILQDLGELSEEHLSPSGAAGIDPRDEQGSPGAAGAGEVLSGPGEVFLYPEWDYRRQYFRPDFCALTEQVVPAGDDAFVARTRHKYRGLAKSIQRVFEAILTETQRQRRQPHGDELDLDALIEAHVDHLRGHEMSDRLYTHFHKAQRSVAVMFMVDMSGSTKGWINDAERESLILLCGALETLGDTYAIYGFSGRTNRRCEVYRVKTFTEPFSLAVERRISGISAKSYTRMGVAIRHLGKLLAQTPARTRLLITLSDGKPEDYGSYRGRYGIEDTRHALLEIKRDGIHPFCITIDREAQDYLPHMYGLANFTMVDDVMKLPWKVADIYRRITT